MTEQLGQISTDPSAAPAPSRIELRLIGDLAVLLDGEPLSLPRSKKTRALLAYLALTGRSHQRDKLCGLFWQLPDDPRGALRWSLSKIRGLVDLNKENPCIAADRNSVTFTGAGVDVDVLELREACRRGLEEIDLGRLKDMADRLDRDLLEGLDQPDLHDFQGWLIAEREELYGLRGRLLRHVVERLQETPEEALRYARAYASAEPNLETAHALLIETLMRAGRQSEAEQLAQLARDQLDKAGMTATGQLDAAAETAPAAPKSARPARRSGDTERPSIAVLPLECMAADRNLEFMTDGLTEDIITLLSRIPGFFVISRSSVFAYKGQRPDIRQVGEDLNVRYVVEGSLRPAGDKARVTIQLIDVETDSHIWADRFEHDLDTLAELQDDITNAIVARLEPELTRAEFERVRRRGPQNLDAWGYYQQAHGILSLKGWRGETFAEALDLLSKAIELDPDFAIAHAYRSLLLAVGGMFKMTPDPAEANSVAADEAETAMRIDSQDSTVLGYVGCALCDIGQAGRGLQLLQRAVEYDPSNAQAWVALGTGQLGTGRPKEGIENLRYGISISPLDQRLAYWETVLAYALFRMNRPGEAIEVARRACRRDDQFQISRVVLAVILANNGELAEAQRAMAEAMRIYPDLKAGDLRGLLGRRGVRILNDHRLLA